MSDRQTSKGEPLTIEDFRDADAPPTADRRREPRFPCTKAIAIRSCRFGEDRGFRPARLLDCSVNGLGVQTDEPMDTGEQFLVRFKLDRLMLAVYTVRHCRRDGAEYQVGAALTAFIGGSEAPQSRAILDALLATHRA
jgi:hypothetical protein